MNRAVHGLAAFGLGLAVAACSDPAAPGLSAGILSGRNGAALTTDSSEYTATYIGGDGPYRSHGFRVVARFENQTLRTLYLARCFPDTPVPIFGVQLEGAGDSWGSAYNPAWACVGHDNQIVVPPAQSRTDTLLIRGPTAFDGRTGQHFGTLTGRMRLVYQVQTCRGDGECRLEGAAVSAPFSVDLAD